MCDIDNSMIKALYSPIASQPHLAAKHLYGQFIGSWQGKIRSETDESSSLNITIDIAWVLEGQAIQDVWQITPTINEGSSTNSHSYKATTLRSYNPETKQWLVQWCDPLNNDTHTRIGYAANNEVIEDFYDKEHLANQICLSEIAPRTFHWRHQQLIHQQWQTIAYGIFERTDE